MLAGFWLAFSGMYLALLLSLGVLSCALVLWLVIRADRADGQPAAIGFRPVRYLGYAGWLAKEIAVSNLDVARRILRGPDAIDPVMRRLPVSQASEAGRVTYANSITLTPGTVSVDLDEETVQVHALTAQGMDSLAEGEMDRRVSHLEKRR